MKCFERERMLTSQERERRQQDINDNRMNMFLTFMLLISVLASFIGIFTNEY